MRRPRLLRDVDADDLGELFLVASVASFLGIRVFLGLTGFPKVGGGGLHIAHMLWGGLLMVAALLILFIFVDRRARIGAAILAGIGFGTFIDEIGKFLTADNDYFFRPAVALVYLAFVALFLVLRAARSSRAPDPGDALAEAMTMVAGASLEGLDRGQRRSVLELLDEADPDEPLVAALRGYVLRRPPRPDDAAVEVRERVIEAFDRLSGTRWFLLAVMAIVVANAAVTVVGTVLALASLRQGSVGLTEVVLAASALVRSAMIVQAARLFPTSRLVAYRWLSWAILVAVFVSEPFLFYRSQLFAVVGLAGDLVVYAGLRFLIRRESAARSGATGGRGARTAAAPVQGGGARRSGSS